MAQLNSNIALGFEAPPIKTPNQARAERLKIQGAENDLQLDRQAIAANEQKLAQNRSAEEERVRKQKGTAKLSELLSQHATVDEQGQRKVDHNAIMNGLASSGFGDTAIAYDTTRRADEAAAIANEVNQLKNAKERGAQFAGHLNAAITKRTPEAADQGIGSLLAGGFINSKQAAEMLGAPKDDAFWSRAEQLRDEHIDYDKQIDAYKAKREADHKAILEPIERETKEAERDIKVREAKGELTPLQKQQIKTADQKEYEFAHDQQGFKGSLEDWVKARANDKAPRTTVNVATPQKTFENEQALRKEFDTLPTVKAFNEVERQSALAEGAYKQLLEKGGSANSADQVIVNVLNKTLDPNSVVREGEYARTAEGQAVLQRLEGFLTRMSSGGAGLSAGERESVMQTIRQLKKDTGTTYKGVEDQFRGMAKDYGFNADRVVAKRSGAQQQLDGMKTKGSGPNVGDVVNVGGKRIKIKTLHGDGTFDGDEVK